MNRLLFVISEDWYFVSHRLHLGIAAKEAGYAVAVLTRVSDHSEEIEAAGIEVFDWPIERRSANPLREVRTVWAVVQCLHRWSPDLCHAVALKPVLYTWVASIGRRAGLVFALGGLGNVFASKKRKTAVLRSLVVAAYRLAFRGRRTRVVLQNEDDRALLLKERMVDPDTVRIIRGAGVDTAVFAAHPEPRGTPLVVLPGRMLWDKGVAEFVHAAVALRNRGVNARFALVGDRDDQNPECVPNQVLCEWVDTGKVEWWGRRSDMADVLRSAAIVCLPSYHEGLPKALIEAASCGRPIVAFDIPGCREIVQSGRNGLLVPLHDQSALNEAVLKLLRDPELRQRMGSQGRAIVLDQFSQEKIARETLAVWAELHR